MSPFWKITFCGQKGDPCFLLELALSPAEDADSDTLNPNLAPNFLGDL